MKERKLFSQAVNIKHPINLLRGVLFLFLRIRGDRYVLTLYSDDTCCFFNALLNVDLLDFLFPVIFHERLYPIIYFSKCWNYIFVDNLLNAFVLKVSNKSCSQILTLSCYDFRNILSAECAVSCAATSVLLLLLLLLNIYKYHPPCKCPL